MANKNNKPTKQATPAPKKQAKEKKNPPVQEAPVQTVETETVVAPSEQVRNLMTKNNPKNLDANHQVDLLGLAAEFFKRDSDAPSKYGEKVVESMNRITACGIIAVMAEQAVEGDSKFAFTLRESAYPMLESVAKDMGITIPSIKSLPAGNEAGTVVVDSKDAKPSAETAKKVKEEKDIESAGNAGEIELDPKKVAHMSEDDLKKALEYLLVIMPKTKKSIKDALVDTVDFMHEYRIELARQAENSTDAMNKIEDRSMYEWLKDIFSYVKPTILLHGIGIGMKNKILESGSPIGSFLILRKNLTDKETGKVCWDDQSIADTVRAIIEFICNDTIKTEKDAIENMDPKDAQLEAVKKGHESVIAKCEEALKMLNDVNFDIIEKYSNGDADALKELGRIIPAYCTATETTKDDKGKETTTTGCAIDLNERPRYNGLESNIKQYAGIIINLFRPAGNKNQNYCEANLVEITKMTMEEYLEAKKAEKEAESKKAQPVSKENDLSTEYLEEFASL